MEIVGLQCKKLAERVAGQRMELQLEPSAIDYLARKGFDPTYGARPVKRAIQSELIQVMANQLLRGIFEEDDTIVVSADKNGLALTSGPKIVREQVVDEDEDEQDENRRREAVHLEHDGRHGRRVRERRRRRRRVHRAGATDGKKNQRNDFCLVADGRARRSNRLSCDLEGASGADIRATREAPRRENTRR